MKYIPSSEYPKWWRSAFESVYNELLICFDEILDFTDKL